MSTLRHPAHMKVRTRTEWLVRELARNEKVIIRLAESTRKIHGTGRLFRHFNRLYGSITNMKSELAYDLSRENGDWLK
jgi:hypothetical protein